MEQSESFWVPLHNHAIDSQRRRAEAVAHSISQNGAEGQLGADLDGDDASPARNGKGGHSAEASDNDLTLPQMFDGEADEVG
jgi:hypothetical protein